MSLQNHQLLLQHRRLGNRPEYNSARCPVLGLSAADNYPLQNYQLHERFLCLQEHSGHLIATLPTHCRSLGDEEGAQESQENAGFGDLHDS